MNGFKLMSVITIKGVFMNAIIKFLVGVSLTTACSKAEFGGSNPATHGKKGGSDVENGGSTGASNSSVIADGGEIILEGKCRVGHKIWIQPCINVPTGKVKDCWSQECKTQYAPVDAVCDSLANASGSSRWQNLRESYSVCVSDALPVCPPNWKELGIFYCTEEKSANLSAPTPGQSVEIISKISFSKTTSVCPKNHTLFVDKCIAPSKNSVRLNLAYSPVSDVCPTFCNEFGCQWVKDGAAPVTEVCVEEELPLCSANWKVSGLQKCRL